MPTRLLSHRTVAERLDVSAKTLAGWIEAGKFPPPTVILPGERGNERWEEVVIEGWIQIQKTGFFSQVVKPNPSEK